MYLLEKMELEIQIFLRNFKRKLRLRDRRFGKEKKTKPENEEKKGKELCILLRYGKHWKWEKQKKNLCCSICHRKHVYK